MRHPDDGTLMALLDGEIPSSDLAPITTHLEGCAECRARLESARAMMAGADALITSLDAPGPAGSGDPKVVALPRRSHTPLYQKLAWAATVVMAAGLGYVVRGGEPGNPYQEPGARALVADLPRPEPDAIVGAAELSAPEAVSPASTARPRAGVPAAPAPTTSERPAERREVATANAQKAQPDPVVVTTQPAAPMAAGRTQTGLAARAAEPAPMALAERAADIVVESFAPIGFAEAIARLGGSIRLVDGLVPERLEASATTVRVVYPLETGELLLEQRRAGDSISVVLRGPVSAESLAVLRGRIR